MAEGGRKRYYGDEEFDHEFKKRRMDSTGDEDGGAPPATLRILVRNQDAGGIIGRGGENIKRLRKTYDCHVVLPDSAGAPERVMTMMGRVPSLTGVLGDVLPTLGSAQDYKETREVQVLIPQPFMGTIIGTGGSKIKELRTKTSCTIKIFSEPMPNSNERSIQLIGTVEQIKECVENFLDDISKKAPREAIYLYEPGGGNFQGGGGGGGGSRDGQGFSPRGRGGPKTRGFGGRGGKGGFNDWKPRGRGGGHFNDRGGSHHSPGGFTGGDGQPSRPPYHPPPSHNSGQVGYTPPPAVGYATASPQNPPPPSGAQYSTPPPAAGQFPPSQPPASAAPTNQVPPPLINQTQQVTIPAEYVEAISGPGGSNLQQIRTQSSCDVVIADAKPGTSERVITITGSTSGIQFAQQLMQNSVRQQHPNV